jgi:protein-L-isoaspartate(D-aspartate) O-methyltransferase
VTLGPVPAPPLHLRRQLLRRILLQVLAWREVLDREALSPRVLAAIARLPRDEFVMAHEQRRAWHDVALEAPCGQRLSQPSIVALMTDLLEVEPLHRVLEIGTGTGYQTAVLSQLAGSVFSVELEADLATDALIRLARLRCANVAIRVGDGSVGWPLQAPFDRIMVTAAAPDLPAALLAQLRRGGRMVLPLGTPDAAQHLVLLRKGGDGEVRQKRIMPVRFVPLRRPGLAMQEGR